MNEITETVRLIQTGIIFILGLLFGSFFNVVIYRLPLGISIVHPPSHCPNCKTRIRGVHNIPVLSYLRLGGMCSYCGYPISIRYPVIELVTGIIFLLVYRFYFFDYYPALAGLGSFDTAVFLRFLASIVFFSVLLIVSIIDLDLFIIPDSLSITGSVLFIVLTPLIFQRPAGGVILGALAGFGFYFLLWLVTGGRGVGLGDAKLMAMIGAYFGLGGVFPIIFISSFIGSIAGIFLIAVRGKTRKTPVPFGPFLALASFIYFFISDLSLPELLGLG